MRVHQGSFLLCPLIVLLLVLAACSGPATPESLVAGKEPARLTICTVNYPLTYFAERIGGDAVDAVFPGPAEINPAFWNPGAGDVAVFQRADLILLNGATFAKWIDRVSLPQARLVDTSKSFSDRFIDVEGAVTHSHGPGGEHAHTGTASFTWLDFRQAVEQARAMLEALERARPDAGATFRKNFTALEADLLALDREIGALTTGRQEQPLVASHPVYQYFTRRYGLNLESVSWEPGEVPAEEKWLELAYGLKAHPSQWMIWEAEPAPESAARLEEMGVRSTVFNPCANVPENGDYLDVMRRNAENLREVFR